MGSQWELLMERETQERMELSNRSETAAQQGQMATLS
jgi:hypothetical protein